MENNFESYLVLNVNHPPFVLNNEEELQNVNSEDSEVKIEVDENENKNRNIMEFIFLDDQADEEQQNVNYEDSEIKIEVDDNHNMNRNPVEFILLDYQADEELQNVNSYEGQPICLEGDTLNEIDYSTDEDAFKADEELQNVNYYDGDMLSKIDSSTDEDAFKNKADEELQNVNSYEGQSINPEGDTLSETDYETDEDAFKADEELQNVNSYEGQSIYLEWDTLNETDYNTDEDAFKADKEQQNVNSYEGQPIYLGRDTLNEIDYSTDEDAFKTDEELQNVNYYDGDTLSKIDSSTDEDAFKVKEELQNVNSEESSAQTDHLWGFGNGLDRSLFTRELLDLPKNGTLPETTNDSEITEFDRMKVERQISASLYAINGVQEYMDTVQDPTELRIQRKPSSNVHAITSPIPENLYLSNSFILSPLLKEISPMMDEFFRTLVENTKSIEGAKVENHKWFVSLNYRNVDEKNWHTIAKCVPDVLENYPRLQLTHQPKILEVHPVIDWNREIAVEFLREILRKGLSNSDERTDGDAFNSNKLYIGKISREQMFAVINFIIEVPTLVFEQLSSKNQILYGILALSISILTVIFSIAEFIYRGRKARAVWRWRRIPWLYCPSPTNTKLFGSATDVIGLVGAILQCIFSGIAFYFYNRHEDNPVNISMWSPVFAFCVMWSQFLENSPEVMLPGIEQLRIEPLKMAPPLKKSR